MVRLMAGGIGVFANQRWWRPVVVGVATFSAVAFILFWDGGLRDLDDKGAFAILINAAIVAAVLVFQRPNSEF